ncbi:hypothetical protein CLV62_104143 [Dysgonomonas alginatilytica]|uniref:Lipoprotein n=1 Tax=Dysgonomonas alginatilytica TaxID=1605892 RepID=A0A2V3PYL7_9BACT|nr:hypothetical protein [Dysgonomonas alginatilytica]PXV66882.1 hypothetical protein CLV62_104143 [Dysgonomonas alginatilytica]
MKIKCFTFFSLLCSIVFVFSSCSNAEIEDMGLGNTGGSGDPKIESLKNANQVVKNSSDTLISNPQPQVFSAGLGNTGGSGDPKSQFVDTPKESIATDQDSDSIK